MPTAPSSIHSVWIRSFGRKSFLQRVDDGAPSLVAFRIGLGNVIGDRIHVGLGLLDGHAGLEAAHREQPVEVVIQLLGFEDERHD